MSRQLFWILSIAVLLYACQPEGSPILANPMPEPTSLPPTIQPAPTSLAFPYGSDEPLPRPRVFPFFHLATVNGLTFTADGTTLYLTESVDERDEQGERRVRIFEAHFVDNDWTKPEPVSFNSIYNDYQPVLSPNGDRLIFNSTRPIPGSTDEALLNLWMVTKTETGWSEPYYLEALNSEGYDGYPAMTRDGFLYFTSDREGGLGQSDIYVAKWQDGAYTDVEHVAVLSSPEHENDIAIDPDGEFMILNRYFAGPKTLDLFLSFATVEGWSEPMPLEQLNSGAWELTPTISPDKRYFFYQIRGQIQQIDLATLLAR